MAGFDAEQVAGLSAYALAGRASDSVGTSALDSLDSPGAGWLRLVAGAAEDVAERVAGGEDLSDVVFEVADGLVPVYTGELWRVFVDLGAWQVDTDDYAPFDGGMEQQAGVSLLLVAEALLRDLVEEFTDEDDEDEDEGEGFYVPCVVCGCTVDHVAAGEPAVHVECEA